MGSSGECHYICTGRFDRRNGGAKCITRNNPMEPTTNTLHGLWVYVPYSFEEFLVGMCTMQALCSPGIHTKHVNSVLNKEKQFCRTISIGQEHGTRAISRGSQRHRGSVYSSSQVKCVAVSIIERQERVVAGGYKPTTLVAV